MNNHELDPEREFAGLRPSAPKLNRDRMLFEAGRASKTRSHDRRYLLVLAVGLIVGLIDRQIRLDRERTLRQDLEIQVAALEQTRSMTPLEGETRSLASTHSLAPGSYGALTRSLLAHKGEIPPDPFGSTEPDSRFPRASSNPSETSTLSVLDSRGSFAF